MWIPPEPVFWICRRNHNPLAGCNTIAWPKKIPRREVSRIWRLNVLPQTPRCDSFAAGFLKRHHRPPTTSRERSAAGRRRLNLPEVNRQTSTAQHSLTKNRRAGELLIVTRHASPW